MRKIRLADKDAIFYLHHIKMKDNYTVAIMRQLSVSSALSAAFKCMMSELQWHQDERTTFVKGIIDANELCASY